jgi:type II secretory pathway component PulK
VNTAPAQVLSALGPDIDGHEIVDYRMETPFEKLSDFTSLVTQGPDSFYVKNPANLLDVKSTYFSAYVKVQVHKVTKFVHAVLKREQKGGTVDIAIAYWREE